MSIQPTAPFIAPGSSPRSLGFLVAAVIAGCAAMPAQAANVYIALGDSITFGETDLNYVGSYGDRGYVAGYANALALAARYGGIRPDVVNLAIDGETASSFMTGTGRTPPVVGRTDVPLALENLNYNPTQLVSQGTLLASTVAAQKAQGNTVTNVTITLGFNELGALASLSPGAALLAIAPTLVAYHDNYASVLTQVRSLLPTASLSLVGYYNPFPADPNSPGTPIFNTGGVLLNDVMRGLAAQFGASFVDTAPSFIGHEAAYTYLDEMKAGSTVGGAFGGVLPIGNVHPNADGYAAITAAVAAVPEPSTWALMVIGIAALLARARRRLSGSGAPAIEGYQSTRTLLA